jgi:hypothetical protein
LYDCVVQGNTAATMGGGVANCTLYGCMVTNNIATNYGGGAFNSTLYDCIVAGNQAPNGAGATSGSLYDCLIYNNVATEFGGGDWGSMLYNCTIISNRSSGADGGVVDGTINGTGYSGTFYNSIIYYNTAPGGGSNSFGGTFVNCDTAPLPPGVGNISNAPVFVNPAAWNLQLQANSPCINAGKNSYAGTTTDFAGNPRIAGGTVDIGAYEYQSPTSIISYAWLDEYGLPTDGSADFADTDGNGMNNWQKWIAGLNPLNPASVLQMLSATNAGSNGVTVTWQSVSNINYFLQRSTNLSCSPSFATIQTNIAGQGSTTSYTDATATNGANYYYQAGVYP